MTRLSFSDARPEHLPAIVEIYNSTVASRMVTADTEPVSTESRWDWFNEHSPDKHPLWIVRDEQHEIIAWVSFQAFYGRPAYNATAEISIYIHEHHRGKGLGKILLQHSIERAPELGIKTLLGFIFAHNDASMKLFHQAGFEDWGHLPNIAQLDGVERTLMILGKRISS
jgi:L-amino acid N-acyltransferase YncA